MISVYFILVVICAAIAIIFYLSVESRAVKKFLDSIEEKSRKAKTVHELVSLRNEIVVFARDNSKLRRHADSAMITMSYIDGKIDGLNTA